MTSLTFVALFAAGTVAGLCGAIAGLASIASYPALLSVGLSPVAANVTNTVAMLSTSVGSIAGARPELRGRWRTIVPLALQAGVGGAGGVMVLLLTPDAVFGAVVPLLVAAGATMVLAGPAIRRRAASCDPAAGRHRPRHSPAVVLAGLYGGYFAAGAGVLMMGVLSIREVASVQVTAAIRNVCSGAANLVAAAVLMVAAPVDLRAGIPLSTGALLGSWVGPRVMRRLPEAPLRLAISVAGFGLAAYLAVG
ncbi:sulfite exporter TauE/SafE family protein [Aeromicrobium sp. Root495]|uniref:sulfite exporter TauE/SafE family protein n=1 Tax=Aeromicrobium sp. Root495 TaxID=1736550 RepID=UPI0009EC9281